MTGTSGARSLPQGRGAEIDLPPGIVAEAPYPFIKGEERSATMNGSEQDSPGTHSGESTMLPDVSVDHALPSFMWDNRITVGQIKAALRSDDNSRRIWLMAKRMRYARYGAVWKFISLDDFLRFREHLLPQLGRQKDFWEFMSGSSSVRQRTSPLRAGLPYCTPSCGLQTSLKPIRDSQAATSTSRSLLGK